jgi:hypothetical protein
LETWVEHRVAWQTPDQSRALHPGSTQ